MDETTLQPEQFDRVFDIDRTDNDLAGLYQAEFRRMARFAAARLGDAEAGRDAVNDAFVIALSRLDTLRDRDALGQWVWSILLNEVRRKRRLKAFRFHRPLTGDTDVADAAVPEVDHRLRRLIRKLPERQRTVVFLKYYGDLTNPVIAELLGVTTGTVSATLHQAQAALRRVLEGGHDE